MIGVPHLHGSPRLLHTVLLLIVVAILLAGGLRAVRAVHREAEHRQMLRDWQRYEAQRQRDLEQRQRARVQP